MQTFRFNATCVTTEQITKSGLCEAVCTGPMTLAAVNALRNLTFKATAQSTAYVVRLELALFVMADEAVLSDAEISFDAPAGAMIVRPDQYDFVQQYALMIAKFGVVRTVWLESNTRLAYQWALRRSCLRSEESTN